MTTRYTPSGIRMRLHGSKAGTLNWLLLPGGPGLGSESLTELADALDVPGSVWLVDLPGDGSNVARDDREVFGSWPGVIVEAAKEVSDAIFVGHSTGGMYLLATAGLHGLICGLVLLDTAADCSWHAQFVAMTRKHPLPAFDQAAAAYEQEPSAANLMRLAVASAEWNFTPKALDAGRALLARLPYNGDAVAWSEAHFDHTYKEKQGSESTFPECVGSELARQQKSTLTPVLLLLLFPGPPDFLWAHGSSKLSLDCQPEAILCVGVLALQVTADGVHFFGINCRHHHGTVMLLTFCGISR
ncbi:alpha/beta hydrolase [Thermomonas sp.]|uniref:alpha/beta fold hydrolase n=1 Tax=Thermomonas sp. TaxID=1971895 RepID=UPI002487DD6E|nr:alpha/beta hydrolase [Thermomonas sp.]MDI1253000.1 alpha/beta hydrolase [Thermomonas sp.]